MNKKTYHVPNFCQVIYKKIANDLTKYGIGSEQFYQFCLAVLLFSFKKYAVSSKDALSDSENQTLDQLCNANGLTKVEDQNSEVLIGLSPSDTEDDKVKSVELLVNYFSCYEALKKKHKKLPDGQQEFERVCEVFENLRQEFALPGRFTYNKFKRRDNPGFSGGIVVAISEPQDKSNKFSDVEGLD